MSKTRLNSEDKAENLRRLFERALGEDAENRLLRADLAAAVQEKGTYDSEAVGIDTIAAYHDGALMTRDAQDLLRRIAANPALIHELEAGAACVAAVRESSARAPAYLKARYVAEATPIINFPRKTAAIAACILAMAAAIVLVLGPALSFLRGPLSSPPVAAIAYMPVAAAKSAVVAEVAPKDTLLQGTNIATKIRKQLKSHEKLEAQPPSVPMSSGDAQYAMQNPGNYYDDGAPQIGNPTVNALDEFPTAQSNFADPAGK